MKKDDVINVCITGIAKYGIFVKYKNYSGLIHISEISDRYVENISDIFEVGEEILVKILEVDQTKKQLVLSYKKALKINAKIMSEVDIKIGFRTLKEELPKWILKSNKKQD